MKDKIPHFLILFFCGIGWSSTLKVELRLDKTLGMGRQFLEENIAKKSKNPMVLMKFWADRRDFAACLKNASGALKTNPSLAPWIHELRMRCGIEVPSIPTLESEVAYLAKKAEWFLSGPQAVPLRKVQVQGWLKLIEHYLVRDRTKTSQYIEEAIERAEWFDSASKANLYRMAGENAFLQQHMDSAESFFARSLRERDDEDVRRRLVTLKSLRARKADTLPGPTLEVRASIEVSESEKELSDRLMNSIRQNDAVATIEDGIELIRKFSGGQRARWATDRIYEAYASVAEKTDSKYAPLQQRVLDLMEKADGPRILGWMEKAFRQGFYADVVRLAKSAIKKNDSTTSSTRAVFLGANAHYINGNSSEARQLYQELTEKHFGTPEALSAFFRIALLDYKKGDFTSAIAYLERLLVLPDSGNYELNARYWLWRSLQKTNSPRAAEEAQKLTDKFPFTYYGLRALGELESGKVSIPSSKEKYKAILELTGVEKAAWDRAQLLMKYGWFEAAQAELSSITEPQEPMARALLASAWSNAMGYPRAIQLMWNAWDQDLRLKNDTFLKIVFPKEYDEAIGKNSKRFGLEPFLLRSLIRQESLYDLKAISSSGALGLTQLMPMTAQECAQDLKVKIKKVPEEVFVPETNILFGSHYLNKMLQKFSQNVPWALAAYNAGPERLGRWARGRELTPQNSSDPSYEMWIDELPWLETQIYVKSILRNLLLYRILDKGPVQLTEPIWRFENQSG